ncbi:hypothetical protein [Kitasatospora viridis]|uniref:Tetratricopeptide repeat protein n=1 Tax=Kitasatospora viridis TaxID=281105 RepID=A0A561SEV7_9ACTN|nr:hypothetical protein [Kitasatospora viridis]TWF73405.1 hypothetical protein FHX73_1516 [Kitasatospora viridis]
MEWFEQAREAEQLRDWDTAISLVSARAVCSSADYHAHDVHLWHMDLLVGAGRFAELAELARTDSHARRRLNKALRARGDVAGLRERVEAGDGSALYGLVQLLCETGRIEEAERAVRDLGPENEYAQQTLERFRPSPDGP